MDGILFFQRKDVFLLCKLFLKLIFTISLVVIPHTFCIDSRALLFIQVPEYKDIITSGKYIFSGKTASRLQCSSLCLKNSRCQGFFYVTTTNLCKLQSSIDNTNNDIITSVGAVYYTITGCSCLEIKDRIPNIKSGLFIIKPTSTLYTVYCVMETDGGGWTVFQRRIDGSVNFTRSYKEYEDGFGNIVQGEFWLGNEIIHRLTTPGIRTLRVDMEDFDGETSYAKYYQFSVNSKSSGYQLTIRGYSGNAGDSFVLTDGSMFTTYDLDQDVLDTGNCASQYKGGWWYDYCHRTNPNGLYLNGTNDMYAKGMCWEPWRGYYYSLKTIRFMFR